jgi:predicted transcriptional regulator
LKRFHFFDFLSIFGNIFLDPKRKIIGRKTQRIISALSIEARTVEEILEVLGMEKKDRNRLMTNLRRLEKKGKIVALSGNGNIYYVSKEAIEK